MSQDVLVDPVVAAEPADLDRGLRPDPVEPGALQKIDILSGLEQLSGIHVVRERRPGADFDDARRDGFPAELPGNRDAMMSVLHEINIAEAVDLDRRDCLPAPHGGIQPGPAFAQVRSNRKERRVEVVGAVDRSTDLCERHLGQTAIGLSFHPGGSANLIEGEQRLRVSAKDGGGFCQETLQTGGLEIDPRSQLFHRGTTSTRRWPTTLMTRVSPICASEIGCPYGCTCPCSNTCGRIQSTAWRTAASP